MMSDVTRFLSHLDAQRMSEAILDAVHLERRRSTVARIVTAATFLGIGAVVGGLAATLVLSTSPRLRRSIWKTDHEGEKAPEKEPVKDGERAERPGAAAFRRETPSPS